MLINLYAKSIYWCCRTWIFHKTQYYRMLMNKLFAVLMGAGSQIKSCGWCQIFRSYCQRHLLQTRTFAYINFLWFVLLCMQSLIVCFFFFFNPEFSHNLEVHEVLGKTPWCLLQCKDLLISRATLYFTFDFGEALLYDA